MKRIDIVTRSAAPALLATLLSTTALAVVPDDAGVLLSVAPRGVAPPVVERLAGDTLAGRSFTAADGRVLEVLLSDGTTLRLAPGSRITIEDYSFDEASREGALTVRVEAGTVRITGGRLSAVSPIRVLTPAGIGELRDGAGVIEVDADGMTTTNLLFGESFTFAANGDTAEIYRPGFEVRTEPEEDLDGPRRDEAGGAEQVAFALNPGLAPAPEGEVAEVEPGAGPTGPTPTQTFPTLVALEETRAEAEEEAATANAVLATRQDLEDDLSSPSSPAAGAGTIGGSLRTGFGLGPTLAAAANLSNDLPSISANATDIPIAGGRPPGLATNIVFLGKQSYSQTLQNSANRPFAVSDTKEADFSSDDPDQQLNLFFLGFADDPEGPKADFIILSGSDTNDAEGPFALRTAPIVTTSNGRRFIEGQMQSGIQRGSDRGDILSIFDGTLFSITDASDSALLNTYVSMLQTGFNLAEGGIDPGSGQPEGETVLRSPDHFFVVQVLPILATKESRRALLEAETFDKDQLILTSFDVEPEERQDRAELAEALAAILLGPGTLEDRIRDLDLLSAEQQERALAQAGRTEQFLFASGAVDGAVDETRRLERFFISPGLEGFDQNTGKPPSDASVASAVRAFLRNATAFREEDGSNGLQLADTGLVVAGTPANSVQDVLGEGGDEQTAAIHVDFGIEGLGSESKLNQRSTISATIGEVAYGVDEEIPGFEDDDVENEVVLRGRTIGSTRGPTEDDPEGERGSVLAVGDVFNTAAGGGGEVGGEPLPGRATYLVIENFDPAEFDPENPETTGGRELPVGAAADPEQFAILRLATATQSVQLPVDPDQETEFRGFAAALGEVVAGGELDLVPLVSGPDATGLVLQFGPKDNRALARLRLIDANTGETRELTLGGLTGTETKGASAFIDPNRFGLRTEGQDAEVAMVSGELVKDGLANLGEGEGADTKAFLGQLSTVDVPDLKWGFFFGDVDSGNTGAGARTHVHLGSWVAGRIADPSRLPRSGTASYGGHAVGNVVNNGNAYTQIGRYQSTWNFGSRAGLTDLNFDGARMRGFTQAAEGSVRFGGGLSGDGRNASIAGAFVRGNETGITAPAGQIGAFTVSGDNYGAAGTFAAKKR